MLFAFLSEFVISWGLWTGSGREFPMISAFESLSFELPISLRGLIFLFMVLSLFGACLMKKTRKQLFLSFVFFSAILIFEDISRLQPWFFIQAAILWTVCIPPSSRKGSRKTMAALVVILAGTYFWSGLHKLNISFLTGIAPWFLEGLGIDGLRPTASELLIIAQGQLPSRFLWLLIFPILELTLGLGLLFKKSRRFASYAGIAMHLLIILVMGPWAKDYNYIIIPWNMALAICLYYSTPRVDEKGFLLMEAIGNRGIALVTLLFFMLPSLNFVKLWDDYLSASLYSGDRTEGSYFFFKNFEKEKNAAFQDRMEDHFDQEGLYLGSEVSFNKWMLSELNVPFYGEPRYIDRLGKKLCKSSSFPAGSGLLKKYKERFNSKEASISCYCEELLQNECESPF